MVTTVSGAAWAIAGTASRLPTASATAATARDRCPRILFHLVMTYSFGRNETCHAKACALRSFRGSHAARLVRSHSWLGTLPSQERPVKGLHDRRAGWPLTRPRLLCYAKSHLAASSSTSAWLRAPWSAAMKWWPITSEKASVLRASALSLVEAEGTEQQVQVIHAP